MAKAAAHFGEAKVLAHVDGTRGVYSAAIEVVRGNGNELQLVADAYGSVPAGRVAVTITSEAARAIRDALTAELRRSKPKPKQRAIDQSSDFIRHGPPGSE